jgi:cystathionine gamma-synthase
VYHGNRTLLTQIFQHWGTNITQVDMTNLKQVDEVLSQYGQDKNVILWAETPSNPLLKVTDIRAVSALCDKSSVPFVVDAPWMTPWLCQPLSLGADLVVHSTTKYFGGHSDLTGGAIVRSSMCKDAARSLFDKAKFNQSVVGAVPSPFDCWLTLRGLRSLSARVDVHTKNAMAVARYLESHDRVSHVHYPGLEGHPGHEIMKRQSRVAVERSVAVGISESGGDDVEDPDWIFDDTPPSRVFGGMVSFQVEGDQLEAETVVGGTSIFKRATSLGGTESLIEHRASVEGPDTITPTNLIRLSVGLENVNDLVRDLRKALLRGCKT